MQIPEFQIILEEIKSIKEDISNLKQIIHPSQEYFDTRALSRISGIPYNTLINQKHLLPPIKKAIRIGTKRYWPNAVVRDWLKNLGNQM
ncbi:MAG: hypothetical protein KJI72_04005 [Patescibacteria group bacterium]|nr:hypothetical protein [Patescibacteria group bacterium]